MLTRVLACCLAACALCSPLHALAGDYDTDMPAHAPELPIETIDGAAALVGRALPKGSDALFPVLKSVFRPWTIAENRVRPVQVKTMHETFDNEYEHVLIQGGKVAAVRLFVMNMDQIKQLTPELVHLYIKDFGEEILDDFEPSPKMKTPPGDVFAIETKDMDQYTPRQWSYTGANKLVYTLCWAPAAYVQVWIETAKFHTARLAEEARKDDAHPVTY